MKKIDVKETFLKLTSRTYPHGTEHMLFDLLPQNLDMDEFGNLYTQIGVSDVMFTSHLDTATSVKSDVIHVIEGDLIKTDGKTILGADDKAGVTIMLYMIQNKIPGLYYFFLGEEVGCIGSKKVAEKHKIEKLPNINKVISFDRRSTSSVITFQASTRCCSDKFGTALSAELNKYEDTFKYSNDPTGVYTDSAQFTSIYPECTNISVGYYSEHTFSERQDIAHLIKLAEACLKVDWNSLPVERDPSKVEYSDYYDDWYGYGYNRHDYGGWGGTKSTAYVGNSGGTSYTKPTVQSNVKERIYFFDKKYDFLSDFTIEKSTNFYTEVNIHASRIKEETDMIVNLFQQIELDYQSILWDGLKLVVYHADGSTVESNRDEMIEYFTEFDLSKISEKSKFDFEEGSKNVPKYSTYDEGEYFGE